MEIFYVEGAYERETQKKNRCEKSLALNEKKWENVTFCEWKWAK